MLLLPHRDLYLLPMQCWLSIDFFQSLKNACRWTGYGKFPLGLRVCVCVLPWCHIQGLLPPIHDFRILVPIHTFNINESSSSLFSHTGINLTEARISINTEKHNRNPHCSLQALIWSKSSRAMHCMVRMWVSGVCNP